MRSSQGLGRLVLAERLAHRPPLALFQLAELERGLWFPGQHGPAVVTWRVPRTGINQKLDFELRNLLMAFRLESDSIINEMLAAKPHL